jgi:hypothetical protein
MKRSHVSVILLVDRSESNPHFPTEMTVLGATTNNGFPRWADGRVWQVVIFLNHLGNLSPRSSRKFSGRRAATRAVVGVNPPSKVMIMKPFGGEHIS